MKTKNEILEIIKENAPVTSDALAYLVFGHNPYEEDFYNQLNELEKSFDIIYTKKGKITTPLLAGYITGQYMVAHGDAYVLSEDGEHAVFNLNDTRPLPYDTVLAQPIRKSSKVNLVRILNRALKEYVGVITPHRGSAVEFDFIPFKSKLPLKLILKKNEIGDAAPFDKIRIRLIGIKKNGNISSEFIKSYGSSKTSEANYNAVLHMYDIKTDFPNEVIAYANSLKNEINSDDLKGRLDLRDTTIFTIDPSDALDLDDAVSLEQKGDNFILGVHIADVSHYVPQDFAIDKEALERGTSVYFTDKVVPMLPKALSNGICSLSENEDRLTISVLITISNDAKVISTEIKNSVIRNVKKCSYDDINAILDGTATNEIINAHSKVVDILPIMNKLAKKLTAKRFARGAIDFAEKECKIVLNDEGGVSAIVPYSRGDSQKMIEEFMLLANEATASFVYWQNIPYIYRVHNDPDNEKVTNIVTIAKGLGYTYKGKLTNNNSLNIQRIVKFFEETPYNHIISILSLRSMKRAAYSNECTGHFGLCLDKYCHFTSPIRRYPDLMCHRIIKLILSGGINASGIDYLETQTDFCAKQSTKCEMSATNAERAIEDMYKAIYMENFIGEKFEAIISSVTNFGFFAELENTVEGLVHISDIPDDYYIFDQNTLSLCGRRKNNKYSIGDKVNVICSSVDVAMGQIEFSLVK